MKNKILQIRPPKQYQEGLLDIEEGIDNIPELIEYLKNGFSMEEARKMSILVRIELIKRSCEFEVEKDGEIQEVKKEIQLLITEYNQIE